jgi:hypothetical protein
MANRSVFFPDDFQDHRLAAARAKPIVDGHHSAFANILLR